MKNKTVKSMAEAEKSMVEATSHLRNRQARDIARLIHGINPYMQIFYDENERCVIMQNETITINISG